jgi:vacuolar-type H+-ATPase subunit H
MPRIRDLLYRFRPASAPGAASASGVPADRTADMAGELQPVFAQLSATEEECRGLVQSAEQQAARILDTAREHARELSRQASERAATARAQAMTRVLRGDDAAEELIQDANRTAAQLASRAEQLLPRYVETVVRAAGVG